MGECARLTIVPATEKDIPIILSFIKGLAEHVGLAGEVTATEEGLRETLFGTRPCAETLVAYSGGTAAGFVLFFHNYSTFQGKPGIYIEDLYVKPECRGMGIGRAMLRHVARITEQRGCGRMEWYTEKGNETATAFYKRMGATPLLGRITHRLSGEVLHKLANE